MRDNLVIGKMHIKGYASIPEMKYSWSRSGLNTIVGENGVGKSSILNALSWCIYGILIKKGSSVEPWEDTKGEDYEGTMVRVEIKRWGHNYKIIRCKEYKGDVEGNRGNNRLVLVVDDKVSDLRDKADVQQEINRIMGRSFDLFKSSTLFGQGLQKIIEQDGPMKKKVFEEAFGITFISEAKKRVEEKIPQLRSDVLRRTEVVKALEDSILMIRETLKLAKKQDKNAIKEWKDRLLEAKEELKKSQENYDKLDIPNTVNNIDSRVSILYEKIAKKKESGKVLVKAEWDLNREMNTIGAKVERMELTYTDFKQRYIEVGNKCPECGQKLPNNKVEEKRKEVKESISKLKTELLSLRDEYNDLEKQYKEAVESIEKFNKRLEKSVYIINKKIEKLEANRASLLELKARAKGIIETREDNLAKIKANKPNVTTGTTESLQGILRVKKLDLVGEQMKLKEAEEELELNEWLLKDPLSNSGLKSYLFNAKMGKVNKRLRRYEDKIGFRVEASINLDKHNKDFVINIYQKKRKRPYEDLSGGQRQLTNLALAFSIYDISNEGNDINVLITDEAFESLSSKNLEVLSDILQDIAQKKSVHVITHQRAFNPTNSYQRVLELNEEGQTVISSKLAQN